MFAWIVFLSNWKVISKSIEKVSNVKYTKNTTPPWASDPLTPRWPISCIWSQQDTLFLFSTFVKRSGLLPKHYNYTIEECFINWRKKMRSKSKELTSAPPLRCGSEDDNNFQNPPGHSRRPVTRRWTNSILLTKIPYTGDIESLDRCG